MPVHVVDLLESIDVAEQDAVACAVRIPCHGRQHFRQVGTVRKAGERIVVQQVLQHVALLVDGEVADHADEACRAAVADVGDGQVHRELPPVLAHRGLDATDADDLRLPRLLILVQVFGMLLPLPARHQHAHVGADGFLRGPSEQAFRRAVERPDRARGVDDDDGLGHAVQRAAADPPQGDHAPERHLALQDRGLRQRLRDVEIDAPGRPLLDGLARGWIAAEQDDGKPVVEQAVAHVADRLGGHIGADVGVHDEDIRALGRKFDAGPCGGVADLNIDVQRLPQASQRLDHERVGTQQMDDEFGTQWRARGGHGASEGDRQTGARSRTSSVPRGRKRPLINVNYAIGSIQSRNVDDSVKVVIR